MRRSLFRSGVCLWRKQDFPAIFEGLERGRLRGEKDFGISLLWIFDAIRQFGAEKAQKVLDLAIQFRERNVIAFGIGGDELAAGLQSGLRRFTCGWRSMVFI